MNEFERNEHLSHWQDRLQDALDFRNTANASAESDAEFHAHAQSCETCRNEFARLTALHARLREEFATPPLLSASFTERLFARIDSEDAERRAIAKAKAQAAFESRMRALKPDWRALWQTHFGSIIAILTVIAALFASSASLWDRFRDQVAAASASIPWLPAAAALPAAAVVAALAVSAAAMWVLRTKPL